MVVSRMYDCTVRVNTDDITAVYSALGMFVQRYGLSELNYRVNTIKREYKRMQRANMRAQRAANSARIATERFSNMTSPYGGHDD